MLSANTVIAHLDLSNNCITAKGAFVLADGLIKNTAVQSLQVRRQRGGAPGVCV
jgi:hypothetical protein